MGKRKEGLPSKDLNKRTRREEVCQKKCSGQRRVRTLKGWRTSTRSQIVTRGRGIAKEKGKGGEG